MGFSSMFELLTKHYGYSEGSADRRLSAMRLSRDVPGVVQAIEAGRLTLSTASQVQHFFRAERKLGKSYTPEQKAKLTHQFEGMSRRECERELLALSPESVLPKERERAVTPTETEIRFIMNDRLRVKFEKLRELFSHHGPLSYAELIERLADQALKKLDPELRERKRAPSVQEHPGNPEAQAPVQDHASAPTPPAVLRPMASPPPVESKPVISPPRPSSSPSCQNRGPPRGICAGRVALRIRRSTDRAQVHLEMDFGDRPHPARLPKVGRTNGRTTDARADSITLSLRFRN